MPQKTLHATHLKAYQHTQDAAGDEESHSAQEAGHPEANGKLLWEGQLQGVAEAQGSDDCPQSKQIFLAHHLIGLEEAQKKQYNREVLPKIGLSLWHIDSENLKEEHFLHGKNQCKRSSSAGDGFEQW